MLNNNILHRRFFPSRSLYPSFVRPTRIHFRDSTTNGRWKRAFCESGGGDDDKPVSTRRQVQLSTVVRERGGGRGSSVGIVDPTAGAGVIGNWKHRRRGSRAHEILAAHYNIHRYVCIKIFHIHNIIYVHST